MENELEIPDLRNLAYFLEIEIMNTQGNFLHQKKYAEDILKRFKISSYNTAITPMETNIKLRKESDEELLDSLLNKQIIGTLRYLCNTWLNICQSLGLVSIFKEKTTLCHLLA